MIISTPSQSAVAFALQFVNFFIFLQYVFLCIQQTKLTLRCYLWLASCQPRPQNSLPIRHTHTYVTVKYNDTNYKYQNQPLLKSTKHFLNHSHLKYSPVSIRIGSLGRRDLRGWAVARLRATFATSC